MIFGWAIAVGGAATPDAPTAQRIHELEWARTAPMQLVTQIPGADGPTRAAAVRALGRLRSAEALDALVAATDDPDPAVRAAVAEALGWTPGAAPVIRERLSRIERPSTPAALAQQEHGELVSLVLALGFQGEPADVEVLRRYLREPWPVGAAAARALGRMGVRKVDGVKGAAGDLAGRLAALDPRTVADCAWALARIGIEPGATEVIRDARRALLGPSTELSRARLVKALWPALSVDERAELFVRVASDPSRLVRVALFDALRPGDVGPEVLSVWLSDPDPWIRWAVLGALGRDGSDAAREALARHREEVADPWEQASAIRAAGGPDPAAAADRSLPPVVRAAEVEALDAPDAWVRLAVDDPEPSVRSAAVGALLEADPERLAPAAWAKLGVELLAAKDPAVREGALELVGRAEPKERVATLIHHLGTEPDADVFAAGLTALAAVEGGLPPGVDAVLARASSFPGARVHAAAEALARAAGRPLPPAPAPPAIRSVILPSGTVVETDASTPSLVEVGRVRRARVATSEGRFVIALDPETAPLAVQNFARLAEAGFFDGMVFHRVVPGFVVQTGCPRGDGWGGPGYVIPDEVSGLDYDVGAVGMARSDRDTGGSQWFVTTSPQPHLVGEYTRFGEVVEGMEVVRRLHPGSRLESVQIDRLGAPE